jgi:hypothetical protein
MRKAIAAAAAAAAIAALAACGPNTTTSSSVAAKSTPTAAAAVATTAPAAPAAPVFTPAQQQVLDSASSYLNSGQGFSKAGLMGQLTSSFGEGFSHKLARFALAQLHPNWNHQAVISARNYMQSGQGFSYAGLVQQLASPYGEQFTTAQAQYGANAAFR